MNIHSTRTNYDHDQALLESEIETDPIVQFQQWLEAAYALPMPGEPNAMCLASVDEAGHPSARMVLLRGLDSRGFVFFTSFFSRKGRDLVHNPHVAATFYWPTLHRQVRIEGSVSPLSDDESDAYFESRPRGHQLAAWASEQSEVVERREYLEERMQHFDERFEGEEVPRPHSWGGYLIAPTRIEFWQGRPNRLHDRIEYQRAAAGWTIRRLQP